jgi:hypothetical protein
MNIDYDNLRSKANLATKGVWSWEDEGNNIATVYSGRTSFDLKTFGSSGFHGMNLFGRLQVDWNGKNNLDFITSASPEIVLALLDKIEELEKNEIK